MSEPEHSWSIQEKASISPALDRYLAALRELLKPNKPYEAFFPQRKPFVLLHAQQKSALFRRKIPRTWLTAPRRQGQICELFGAKPPSIAYSYAPFHDPLASSHPHQLKTGS